jgi:hypothetical protein
MLRLLGCALLLPFLVQCHGAPEHGAPDHTTSPKPPTTPKRESVRVSFRLDPRLVGGTYGGERWMSGTKYTSSAQPGSEAVVEAKVDGVRTAWIESDPAMVTVSPVSANRFDRVRITIHHVGESKLTVKNREAATVLVVRAKALGTTAMQAEITQIGGAP